MLLKKCYTVFTLTFLLAIGIFGPITAQTDVSNVERATIGNSQGLITKLIVVPPYPASFRELMEKQGNTLLLQNPSGTSLHLSFHFTFASLDGNINISSLKPVMEVDLAPNSTKTIPLNQFWGQVSVANTSSTGISKEVAMSYKPLPEGYYTLCLKPMQVASNRQVGKDACSVTIPMFAIEPPTLRLTSPTWNDTVQNAQIQNLMFQWNTPSRIDPILINTLKATLKIVEVPEGLSATQAFQSAPSRIIAYTTQGQNMFLYGTNCTPLVRGRRYAAAIQINDPLNKSLFRNNGTSEVISFVFGKKSANAIDNNLSHLQGSVLWAYKAEAEVQTITNTPLVAKTPLTESVQSLRKSNSEGKITYPLANAIVEVYGSDMPNQLGSGSSTKMALGSAKTDENGNYDVSLIMRHAMQKFKYVMVEITHPSGLFSKVVKTIDYSTVENNYNLNNVVLVGQTLELTPRVLLADGTVNNNVSISILMPEKQWDKYALLSVADLGKERHKTFYNNQYYTVVATLKNGDVYKHLFQTINANEHYLVQINYPNKPSAYYPLDEVFTTEKDYYNQKPVIAIVKNFVYDNTNVASGQIWYNGKGINNVKVSLIFNPAEVVGAYDANKTYTAISELSGSYHLVGLPTLKEGATIRYTVEDRTLNDFPLQGELVVGNQSKWTKDFTFTDSKLHIKGQIVNESGKGIDNAFIMAIGTNKAIYSDNQGYYSISLSKMAVQEQLQVIADEYEEATIAIADFYKESKKRSSKQGQQNDIEINLGKTVLKQHVSDASVLLNVVKVLDNNNIRKGTLTITPTSVAGKPVKIDLSKVDSTGFSFNYGAAYDPFGYNVSFSPEKADEETLAPATYRVMLASNAANKVVTFGVSSTKVIMGIVKAKTANGAAIAQQLVTVAGTSYFAISDKSGRFQLTVPDNQPVRLQASRVGYLNFDSSYSGLNDTIIMIPSLTQAFNTLLGYPANVTFMQKLDSVSYVISGYMSVANNAVFKATTSANVYFNNVKVGVDKITNAILKDTVVNLSTNSTTLDVFGFAKVQVTGLQLKATVGDITKGLLSGKIVLNPTIAANASLDLPQATLKSVLANVDSLRTVFSYADAAKFIDTAYSLYFTSKGMVNKTLANINASLNFDTARLFINGIKNLRGNLQLGDIRQFVTANANQIPLQVGILGTDFKINQLTVNNVSKVILDATIQKVRASFNDINVKGLNTPNTSLWMGGAMKLAKNLADSLPFDAMSLVKNPLGYAMSSLMNTANAKTKGLFDVKGFNFLPKGIDAKFFYSTQNDCYNLNLAGTLNMNSATTDPASKVVTEAVFNKSKGVDAQFNLQTSNWGVFIAASPNQTADLGIASVNIGSFLVSIGSSASLASMDSILQGTKSAKSTISFDTSMVDALLTDWALGVAGSISFPLVGSAKASSKAANGGGAIVLLSNTNKFGFEAQVDTFYINIATSTMTVNAGGSMVFTRDKHGFAMNANVVLNNLSSVAGFGGHFKFFKFDIGGGIQLGTSLLVQAEIPVGPVTFHSLGGGFDFNFSAKIYSVFINGDLGPTGVPKEVVNISCWLGIESSAACNYLPIVTGYGSAVVADKMNVAQANMTMDICRKYFMVTITADFDLPEPLSDVKLNGSSILFIAAPSQAIKNGCFFYQASVDLKVAIINIRANAGFGIGYNVNTSNPYIPASYMTQLASFVGTGTLNGMYVYANVNQRTSGNFDFNAGVFSFYCDWDQSVDAGMTFYANIDQGATINLSTYFKTHLGANGGVSLLGFGIGLGGSLDVGFSTSTGYKPLTGFYAKGSGRATLQVWGGTSGASGIGCNSFRLSWCNAKICIPIVGCASIPYPCGVQAKACIGAGFDYGVQSGQSPYVKFYL